MKRQTVLLCVLLLALPALLFAQGLGPWDTSYGEWTLKADGRLYQLSTKAGMAQAYMRLPQKGAIQYEFDVKYVDGAQDSYAAFGVHIGVDNPAKHKSWGNGKSFLLWLTFDPKAFGGSGVFAQAYQSQSNSEMGLVHPAKAYMIPQERLEGIYLDRLDSYILPVKIKIDYSTGAVKVYDPIIPNYYYRFSLGGPIGGGLYVAVRTSSLAASFGNFKVTPLDKF
jgi:hypothetical protein